MYSEINKRSREDELHIYLERSKQQIHLKLELFLRNQNAAKRRPDSSVLGKLDSSLKKNTAFIKKLRTFNAGQLEQLVKDSILLNLTKYLSEVTSALVEAKLKSSDVMAAVSLCTEFNCTYSDFASIFQEEWIKMLTVKKDEPIPNINKFRMDLRFYAELIICGVFSQRDSLPLLGTVLTALTNSKDYHNAAIILHFCKHCGYDFAGLVPQQIRNLTEEFDVTLPYSSFISSDKKTNVLTLFREYYSSLCEHLYQRHLRLRYVHKKSKQTKKSELQMERTVKDGDGLQAHFESLLSTTVSLANLLGMPVPDFPEMTCNEEGTVLMKPWDDEETRQFYEEFPDVNEYLPNKDVNVRVPLTKCILDEKPEENNIKGTETDVTGQTKEDEQPLTEESESSIPATTKSSLDNFLKHLTNCVNKEMVDNAAVEFLLYLNSRYAVKKLINTLFVVQRNRLNLLPLYARLVAILSPVIPETCYGLNQQLRTEIMRHIHKKDQVNIESKIKAVRFVGELVNFRLYPKTDALIILEMLIHDFSHHHIEMACNLLETCGRFLYCSNETHQTTKNFLDQMMRLKTMMTLDIRYTHMIEYMYYLVIPRDISQSKLTEPVLHHFINKLIFQDLMEPGSEDTILEHLRSVDWECEITAQYVIMCLTNAAGINYQKIPVLASLVAELVEYQEFVGFHVVDSVIEDIRLGLELNITSMNQRRIAMVKYLGELYTYKLVDSHDIFTTLFTLITFGVTFDHNEYSPLDSPTNLLRIRLVLILLDTCGPFFTRTETKIKLSYFITYFQYYYWYKRSSSVWTNDMPFPENVHHMLSETIETLCPNINLCTSYKSALIAVRQLNTHLMSEISHNIANNSSQNFNLIEEYIENEDINEGSVKENELSEETKNYSDRNMQTNEDDFQKSLDKMVSENMKQRECLKPSNVDISIPLSHKTEQETSFVVILKKGNKQHYKKIDIPEDSDLFLSLKLKEEAERKEMEKVKKLTLDISQRLQVQD